MVGNQYGYRCPACSNDEQLVVQAHADAMVALKPTADEVEYHKAEWEDEDYARCNGCKWEGRVEDLMRAHDEGPLRVVVIDGVPCIHGEQTERVQQMIQEITDRMSPSGTALGTGFGRLFSRSDLEAVIDLVHERVEEERVR